MSDEQIRAEFMGKPFSVGDKPPAANGHDAQEGQPIFVPPWASLLRRWVPPAGLETRPVSVSFAVDGWIQAGHVGALVAAGGVGKTTLLLYLAICIALGRPFFGCAVTQGTFVLLSADDSQEDLDIALALVVRAMRLSHAEVAMVAEKARVFSLMGVGSRDDCKTFSESVRGTVMATGLPEFVLHAIDVIPDLVGIALDTLRQFAGGSSNDEQVIKTTISGATEIAGRTGAFVVLPHHTGKQNYREELTDMYCGSGSAAIADNCRFVLLLQNAKWPDIEAKVRRTGRESGDPLVLISTRGSLLVRAPEPIYLHREGFLIGRIAGASLSKDEQADDKDRAILRAVRNGAQTKRAIVAVVKGGRSEQFDRIDELEGRGFLVNQSTRRSAGEYVLGPPGVHLLDDSL